MTNNKVVSLDSDINVLKLSKKILKNEPKIIKKYPPRGFNGLITDGYTGLGLGSLTSRFYHFNVLKWWGTRSLRKWIRKGYEIYNGVSGTLCVQCWANVMRNGEEIKSHNHSENSNTLDALSGHLCVQVDRFTSTYYQGNPISNENGVISFFPSSMYHWTDKYVGDSERITVAFDIRSLEYFERDIYPNAREHWIKI